MTCSYCICASCQIKCMIEHPGLHPVCFNVYSLQTTCNIWPTLYKSSCYSEDTEMVDCFSHRAVSMLMVSGFCPGSLACIVFVSRLYVCVVLEHRLCLCLCWWLIVLCESIYVCCIILSGSCCTHCAAHLCDDYPLCWTPVSSPWVGLNCHPLSLPDIVLCSLPTVWTVITSSPPTSHVLSTVFL